MAYDVDLRGQTLHVELRGSMYAGDATAFRRASEAALEGRRCSRVEVDLSHLDYIDSAGLEVFIYLHKHCVKEGGSLAVRGLSGPVKGLFEITRLDKVFLWE